MLDTVRDARDLTPIGTSKSHPEGACSLCQGEQNTRLRQVDDAACWKVCSPRWPPPSHLPKTRLVSPPVPSGPGRETEGTLRKCRHAAPRPGCARCRSFCGLSLGWLVPGKQLPCRQEHSSCLGRGFLPTAMRTRHLRNETSSPREACR